MIDLNLITAIVFGAAGFIFVALGLSFAGRILRGRAVPTPENSATYECGELPVGNAWNRFNPRFLLLAIVFIIFDIEIAFLFPWGTVYRQAGFIAFWDMIVFLAILLAGYFWLWRIGELRWVIPGNRDAGKTER